MRRSLASRCAAGAVALVMVACVALPAVAREEGPWSWWNALSVWFEGWLAPWEGAETEGPGTAKAGPEMDPNGNPLPPPSHGEVGPDMDPDG